MVALKHPGLGRWPPADQAAWKAAFKPGDLFEGGGGAGAHLAPGSRKSIARGYARWLAYLAEQHPDLLGLTPAVRLRKPVVRGYIEELRGEVANMTVAIYLHQLYLAVGLLAPGEDWTWLRRIKASLEANASPQDRFHLLCPPWQLLDLGIALMEGADPGRDGPRHLEKIRYRNGLILALLAVWPIRRRSLAALTVTRHIERSGGQLNLLLPPEDTKAGRSESFRVPDPIQTHLEHYVRHVRPEFPRAGDHDGLWASSRAHPLGEQRLYEIVRRLTESHLGRAMALHDVRRAAVTFLAIEAPEKIGLAPGILQHASPEVSQQHYNLARSTEASRRYGNHVAKLRAGLRSHRPRRGGE